MKLEETSAVDKKLEQDKLNYERNLEVIDYLVNELDLLLRNVSKEQNYLFIDDDSGEHCEVSFDVNRWKVMFEECEMELYLYRLINIIYLDDEKTKLIGGGNEIMILSKINDSTVLENKAEGLEIREKIGFREVGKKIIAWTLNKVDLVLHDKGIPVQKESLLGEKVVISYAEVNKELELVRKALQAAKETVKKEEKV